MLKTLWKRLLQNRRLAWEYRILDRARFARIGGIRAIKAQSLEAILQRVHKLPLWELPYGRRIQSLHLGYWKCTFVSIPGDPRRVLILHTRDQAHPSCESVADRVERNKSLVGLREADVDDKKVVDVLQVFNDPLSGNALVQVLDLEVASGSLLDFLR